MVDTINPWARLIIQIGVPSAIAMYLVWQLSSGLTGDVRLLNERLEQHMQVTTAIQGSLALQTVHGEIMINLLRQQCVNASHTLTERNACFTAGTR